MPETALKFSKSRLPLAPDHLQEAGGKLWTATVSEWQLSDSELVTLCTACECADRLAGIRAQIDADGVVIVDPSERKRSHPLLAAEAQIMGV